MCNTFSLHISTSSLLQSVASLNLLQVQATTTQVQTSTYTSQQAVGTFSNCHCRRLRLQITPDPVTLYYTLEKQPKESNTRLDGSNTD